jgi:hypothetical protein
VQVAWMKTTENNRGLWHGLKDDLRMLSNGHVSSENESLDERLLTLKQTLVRNTLFSVTIKPQTRNTQTVTRYRTSLEKPNFKLHPTMTSPSTMKTATFLRRNL